MFMTGGVCFVNNALNMTRVARQSDMGQQEFLRKSLEEENALRRAVNEVFLSCESIHDWIRIFDPEHRNRMSNKYVTMWGAVMHFEAVLGNFTVKWRGLPKPYQRNGHPLHHFQWQPGTWDPNRLHPHGVHNGIDPDWENCVARFDLTMTMQDLFEENSWDRVDQQHHGKLCYVTADFFPDARN